MAKAPVIIIQIIELEDAERMTINELTWEIGKRLYEMSKNGQFKIHERGIVSDMTGIKADG